MLAQGVSASSTTLAGLLSVVPGQLDTTSLDLTAQGCTVPTDLVKERDWAEREADIAERNVDIALGAYGVSLTSIAACFSGPAACAAALGGVVITGATLGTAARSWTAAEEEADYAQGKIDSWKRSQKGCNWS